VEKFGEVAAEFYPQVFADLRARLDPVMDQQPEEVKRLDEVVHPDCRQMLPVVLVERSRFETLGLSRVLDEEPGERLRLRLDRVGVGLLAGLAHHPLGLLLSEMAFCIAVCTTIDQSRFYTGETAPLADRKAAQVRLKPESSL